MWTPSQCIMGSKLHFPAGRAREWFTSPVCGQWITTQFYSLQSIMVSLGQEKNGGNIEHEWILQNVLKHVKYTGLGRNCGLKRGRMAGKIRLASSGGDIKIWDMPELSMVKAFSPHSQPVGSLCWSPNSIFSLTFNLCLIWCFLLRDMELW